MHIYGTLDVEYTFSILFDLLWTIYYLIICVVYIDNLGMNLLLSSEIFEEIVHVFPCLLISFTSSLQFSLSFFLDFYLWLWLFFLAICSDIQLGFLVFSSFCTISLKTYFISLFLYFPIKQVQKILMLFENICSTSSYGNCWPLFFCFSLIWNLNMNSLWSASQ